MRTILSHWSNVWIVHGAQWQWPAFLLIVGTLLFIWLWTEWRGLSLAWVVFSFAQTTLFFPLMPLRWALGQFLAGTFMALLFAIGGKMRARPRAVPFHWHVGLTFRLFLVPLLLLLFIGSLPARQWLAGLSQWQQFAFILEIETALWLLGIERDPVKIGMALLIFLWASFFPLLILHLRNDFWLLAMAILQIGIAWTSSILTAWQTVPGEQSP